MDEKSGHLNGKTVSERGQRYCPIVADGGERQGETAPPEDILAAPANQLDTVPHPRDVTEEIIELLDAAENLVSELEHPRDHGINPRDSEVEQLTALAEAVADGDISLTAESAGRAGSSTDPVRELTEGVREVRDQQSVESVTARQLLDDLETVETRQPTELAATITETVEELEGYQTLKRALGSVSTRREPARLGRELTQEFDSLEVENTGQIARVGRTLEKTAQDLSECQTGYRQLSEATETICASAATQTAWSAGTNDIEETVTQLAAGLDEGTVWFADDTTSIAGFAARVDASDAAQSKPATEFLDVLRNIDSASDQQVRDSLRDAVEAIDRTETITTRLDGVDPEAVEQTADRLLSDLSTLSSTVVPYLRERIADIKETAQRSNDADLLTLYASRQELRYYDRTLIPQLTEPTDDDEAGELKARIEAVDDRRSEMRQSYPSEYPDCDHTIPIYFFDLASTLLEDARDLHTQGESQQAAALADAGEQVLEWIEGLYETHSYFVLLKELRG